MLGDFQYFQCLAQSEVKMISLVKYTLLEVRFNPPEMRLSHQSMCSLLEFWLYLTSQVVQPRRLSQVYYRPQTKFGAR